MPWERSQLWLARLHEAGTVAEARRVAGSGPGDGRGVSVFQPLWAGADLVVANDRSGWWNLERLVGAEALPPDGEVAWEPLLPMEAEFGQPQWVYGLATIAWDGERLLACACREGRWPPPGGWRRSPPDHAMAPVCWSLRSTPAAGSTPRPQPRWRWRRRR
jgi:hypothetical protein